MKLVDLLVDEEAVVVVEDVASVDVEDIVEVEDIGPIDVEVEVEVVKVVDVFVELEHCSMEGNFGPLNRNQYG